jgi:hypothetical protein
MRLHGDVSVEVVQRSVGLFAAIPATLVHAINLFVASARALVLLGAGDGYEGVDLEVSFELASRAAYLTGTAVVRCVTLLLGHHVLRGVGVPLWTLVAVTAILALYGVVGRVLRMLRLLGRLLLLSKLIGWTGDGVCGRIHVRLQVMCRGVAAMTIVRQGHKGRTLGCLGHAADALSVAGVIGSARVGVGF